MTNSELTFRVARTADLKQILLLLADDVLGSARENVSAEIKPEYKKAFYDIEADPNNELIVGVLDDLVVAVLQVTYIPNLTLKGTRRAQIEGVRVSSSARGKGVGQRLFSFTFERSRQKGCKLAQLTTDKTRVDAIRFYEKLGFESTHEGMKIQLNEST